MTTFMAGIAAVVMSLTMGASGVAASAGNHFGNADGVRGNRDVCANFTDENGDGVCDNKGTYVNFVDENNDGICDNRVDSANRPQKGTGKRAGNGCASENTNFTDENGDGVCGNRGTNANFTDEDGDGICDNKGSRLNCPKDGTGRKVGKRMGKNK